MTSHVARLLSLARHPVHHARAALDFLATRPLPDAAQRTWRRLWVEERPLLADSPPTSGGAAPREVEQTVVRLAGVERRAMIVRTPASIVWRTTSVPGSRVRVWCAIMPSAWAEGARVRVELRAAGSGRTVTASADLEPARSWTSRRWRLLTVVLDEPALISLDVSGSRSSVPVAIADAVVRWRRAPGEVRALFRAFLRRLREGGIRDTARWAQRIERRSDDAERYREWCRSHTPDAPALEEMRREAAAWTTRPRFSILVPTYNTDPTWLDACVASVRAQVYTDWELILSDDGSTRPETRVMLERYEADTRIRVVWNTRNQGIAGATAAALSFASGEFVALLDHDDVLMPHALYRVAESLRATPDLDVIYSDEDKLELDGSRSDVYLKPDWSPDLFLSSMYVCHFLVMRRRLVEHVGGFRAGYDGSQDYDLALRVIEHTTRIHHIADVLYHWRKIPQSTSSAGAAKPWAHLAGRRALQDYADRRGLRATVEDAGPPGLYRMHYALRAQPRVSLVISLGAGEVSACRRLMDAVARSTYPEREVVIVAAPEVAHEARGMAAPTGGTVVEWSGPVGAGLNGGAAAATGLYLIFVAATVEPQHPDWIEALLEHAQRPEVAGVGAKLFRPDGRLRHIGLVCGAGGKALRPFDGYPGTWAGYFSNASCVRNCLAVSRAACMFRRDAFEAAGRWAADLDSDRLEIDLGWRFRAAGLLVVFTPYARLTEYAADDPPGELACPAAPLDGSRQDPYYNPHFAAGTGDYIVRSGRGISGVPDLTTDE